MDGLASAYRTCLSSPDHRATILLRVPLNAKHNLSWKQGLGSDWTVAREEGLGRRFRRNVNSRSDQVGTSVLPRVISIRQFQLRRKLFRILRWWLRSVSCRCDRRAGDAGCGECECRGLAFVHLFLNIKGRPSDSPRVPSEYISELGRIRTDLDQFSPIEREAVMYHGYTLIDAQIKKCCKRLLQFSSAEANGSAWFAPPLFRD